MTEFMPLRDTAAPQFSCERLSDRQLVKDLNSGDEAIRRRAFAAINNRYSRLLLRYVSGRMPDDQAQDIVQDTFEALIQSLAKHVEVINLKAWLYGVAHHKIVNYYRRQRAALPLDEAGLDSNIVEDDDLLTRLSVGPCVAEAVSRLRKADRETIVLSFWCDLTNDEIAATRGVTVRSVTVSKSRALAAMRTDLRRSAETIT